MIKLLNDKYKNTAKSAPKAETNKDTKVLNKK